MDLQTLLIDYLAKTLGKSNDSISELLFKKTDDGKLTDEISETALSDLEELHANHVSSAPDDVLKAKYNEGHKAGKFEALSKEESDLKKQYSVDGKNLKEIIAAITSKAANDAGSDDKVLTHPLYLSLKADSEAELEKAKADAEAQIAAVTTKAERQSRFTTNLSKIETAMAEAGVVMPKNPAAAATLKREFLKQFEAFDFEEQETGVYLKDSEGKLVKDKHGHPVKLEDFAKSKAPEWFDIEKQPGRQSAGNEGGDPPTTVVVPKTQEEFSAAFYAETDPAKKAALATAFEAANKK